MHRPLIASTGQMRDLDSTAIRDYGIPGAVLMENAGRETVRIMEICLPALDAGLVTIVAGKGNNGGDGFVTARHLHNRNVPVEVVLLGKLEELKGDARLNADIAARMGIPVTEIREATGLEDVIWQSDVIVDAIFGTGLTKPAGGLYARAVEAINDSDAFVVSIDIPSGLNADTPAVTGPAVRADLTVTYGLTKPALVLFPSAEYAGQVVVVDISLPRPAVERAGLPGELITPYLFPGVFRERSRNSHKGHFGHLLIVAGSPGKTGAAVLAARAALRGGSGLVTLAACERLNSIFEMKLTEAMTALVPGHQDQWFDSSSLDAVLKLAESKSAVLIGPGIGMLPGTGEFVRSLTAELNIPVVIDADGLNLLAGSPPPWNRHGRPVIATPHPGEMSRLTGMSVRDLLADPVLHGTAFASTHSLTAVFKTARSMVFLPDGRWGVNITGNPGLATGGSGDVLAGLIAGYLAQGHSPAVSATAGVFIHGLAADLAAADIGEPELIPGDLLDYLGPARTTAESQPSLFTGEWVPYPDIALEDIDDD